MSDSSLTSSAEPFQAGPGEYELSDLARLCLPSEFRDEYRRLAWVDSICLLFLIIGLIGIKPPRVIERPIVAPVARMQVEFSPPEEQPKPEPELKPDEEPPPTVEEPQVARIVAVSDPTKVAFPVPVAGATAVAEARYATAPPAQPSAPSRPTKFNPNTEGGTFPPPEYPGYAQRNHYEGVVVLDIRVDEGGSVSSVKVQKSSGFPILDSAAADVVKNRWRFPPGAERWFYWECTFTMK